MTPMTLIAALLMAVAVFLIVQGFTPSIQKADLLEARLRQFGEAGQQVSLTEAELSLPFRERVIKPLFERIGRIITNRVPTDYREEIDEKLALAGQPSGLNVPSWLVLAVSSIIMGSGLGFLLVKLTQSAPPLSYLFPLGGLVIGYLLPESFLNNKIRGRQKEMLLSLPSCLDLLTVSSEAGLVFDAALTKVTEKYKNALSEEFAQTLAEIRLGRTRTEALQGLADRVQIDEVNSLIQAIIQSEQLGVGIAKTLRIQSEEIRRRRRQKAEELGQKASIKMLLPMVGCIFPTLFIILLGPAAIMAFGLASGK